MYFGWETDIENVLSNILVRVRLCMHMNRWNYWTERIAEPCLNVFETVIEAMHDYVDQKLENGAFLFFDENSIFWKFLFWNVIYWNWNQFNQLIMRLK